MSDIVVLPATWAFPIGAILSGTNAVYTVIDRASDVSGVASYRVIGVWGDENEAYEGWLPQTATEDTLTQTGETTVYEVTATVYVDASGNMVLVDGAAMTPIA